MHTIRELVKSKYNLLFDKLEKSEKKLVNQVNDKDQLYQLLEELSLVDLYPESGTLLSKIKSKILDHIPDNNHNYYVYRLNGNKLTLISKPLLLGCRARVYTTNFDGFDQENVNKLNKLAITRIKINDSEFQDLDKLTNNDSLNGAVLISVLLMMAYFFYFIRLKR